MRKITILCLFLLTAAGALYPSAATLGSSAEDGVRSFYATLLTTMKQGQALGQRGRYARLAPAVQQLFDVPFMTQIAVGPAWLKLSAADQRRVIEAFSHYICATYADRFDSYSGEQLQVLGEHPYNSQIIVETRIVKSTGEPVTIDYLMQQTGAGWQITDVYLDSTISQLAVYRSEFAAILNDQGVDGLIAALNRKTDLLTGGAAGPS
jgi:phospholipid transport system substrate-binding protein